MCKDECECETKYEYKYDCECETKCKDAVINRPVLTAEVIDECANMLLEHVGEEYAIVVLHMPVGKPEELLISGNVTPYGVKSVMETFFMKG